MTDARRETVEPMLPLLADFLPRPIAFVTYEVIEFGRRAAGLLFRRIDDGTDTFIYLLMPTMLGEARRSCPVTDPVTSYICCHDNVDIVTWLIFYD
ncbi:hypothetical protein [Micromonospora sp. NPDC005220]|uniref:hypothetical protein n=1 Tax=Micromonospora sp. NPDC005220 TaxID=3155589 RepID=UPI0033B7F024